MVPRGLLLPYGQGGWRRQLTDAGEVMDAGEGTRGQTNAPKSEAPIFLAKGNLQVVL